MPTAQAGLVLVTINPLLRAAEIEYILKQGDVRALFFMARVRDSMASPEAGEQAVSDLQTTFERNLRRAERKLHRSGILRPRTARGRRPPRLQHAQGESRARRCEVARNRGERLFVKLDGLQAVPDGVAVAQRHLGHGQTAGDERSTEIVERIGMAKRRDRLAGVLTYAEQRALEDEALGIELQDRLDAGGAAHLRAGHAARRAAAPAESGA